MHQDIHGMAIMAERQMLPARAARGWQAEQVQANSSILQPVLARTAKALNFLRAIQTQAVHLPNQSGVQHRTTAKRLIDLLPTE